MKSEAEGLRGVEPLWKKKERKKKMLLRTFSQTQRSLWSHKSDVFLGISTF